MFSKVLVATDGSECARKAFDSAIEMVKMSHGTLTIIHVIQLPPTIGFGKKLTREVESFFRKDAEAFLAEKEREAKIRGVKADTVLLKGNPAKAILYTAKSMNADLIVVGSRGLGGVKGLLLGSVSNGVVHASKVSVLVAK
jgi:nucleotide-binding universal stress UspA family protein